MSISINSGNIEIEIVNVYIPPVNSADVGLYPRLSPSIDWRTIGDVNAYHVSWHSYLANDQLGILNADQIDDLDFTAINEDFFTRITEN